MEKPTDTTNTATAQALTTPYGSIWRNAESAPKDGTAFLGNIGYAFAVVCVWSEGDEEWVYAMPVCGGGSFMNFEVETDYPHGLKGWTPIPEIQSNKAVCKQN